VGKICYAVHNNKDKVVVRVCEKKKTTLRLINLKHPIYYVITAPRHDKVKSPCQDYWLLYLSIYGLYHLIIATHCDFPSRRNQTIPSQNPLTLRGVQTTHNHEHGYHDSLHSSEVCTLYQQVVISSPFGD
jgi:hypothetical protein